MARRTRIIAGRYQAMGILLRSLRFLSIWRRPLVVWQIVSHKFMRPLVPLWMALAFLANLAALAWPLPGSSDVSRSGGMLLAWLGLAFPWNWSCLALQLAFYGMAWAGSRLQSRKGMANGPAHGLARLLYLPAFLVNSNLAAVLGLYQSLTGKQAAVWERVARRKPGLLK
jgi:hypothetical protein